MLYVLVFTTFHLQASKPISFIVYMGWGVWNGDLELVKDEVVVHLINILYFLSP